MPDSPPADPAAPVDPDDRPVFEALLAAGVAPRLAYTALQSVRDMAAANLIARFEAKLDALGAAQRESAAAQNASQNAEVRAQNASQNAEVRAQRWMIGAILALLGLGLFNVLAPPQTSPAPQPVIVMPAAPAPPAAPAAAAN